MPDDGNRYDVIDGMLVVTPAPGGTTRCGYRVAHSTTPTRRKAHYERTGVPSYWLLDPTAHPPELRDGAYVQAAHVVGDEPHAAERPIPVTVVPARLLDGTRA